LIKEQKVFKIKINREIGARRVTNCERVIPKPVPKITFGGSPIKVELPPIFAAQISASINDAGSTFNFFEISILREPMKSITVMLSINAARIPGANENAINIKAGTPFVIFKIHELSTSKNHSQQELLQV